MFSDNLCFMQTVRRPYGFKLAARSSQALWIFNLTLNFFQKPQRRNASTTPQVHRKVTVRWPYGDIRFLLSLWCPGNRTAILRWPYGALTAAVRLSRDSCNNREGTVRSPPGLLAAILQFLISWIVRSPCGCRNICDHYYRIPQDLTIFKITFTNRRPKNRTATVRRQHDVWPRHYKVTCDASWAKYVRHEDKTYFAIRSWSFNNNINCASNLEIWVHCLPFPHALCGLVCQRQVSMAGTSNYIPQILWGVITHPCPWYLHASGKQFLLWNQYMK